MLVHVPPLMAHILETPMVNLASAYCQNDLMYIEIIVPVMTSSVSRRLVTQIYDSNTYNVFSLFSGHSGRVQLDNEADREPDYVLMSMGPSQNELTPWAVVTSTALADEVGNVYPVRTGTGYVTSNCRHESPASLVIC